VDHGVALAAYDNSRLAKFVSAGQQMVDVFDTGFPARMAASISNAVASRTNDPWCLGYFVENELPWAGWGSGPTEQYALPTGVLASTNALPRRLSSPACSRANTPRYPG
jgi:hypothetical protein